MRFFKPKQEKWYIVAMVKGRQYADGPYNSEKEARAQAWKSLSGIVFDVVPSDIANKAQFYQTYKHKIWQDTGDFELAVQRMRHTISDKDKVESKQQKEDRL